MNGAAAKCARLLAIAGLALLLLLPAAAAARVGGGQSFSGGGGGGFGGGGGGDGGGDGEAIVWLIYLCIRHPTIGIPLTIVIIAVAVYGRSRKGSSTVSRRYESHTLGPPPKAAVDFARLREIDPNFSVPLFLDFARLLYVRLHECRGDGDFEPIRPYVAAHVLESLSTGQGPRDVSDVIVAACRITSATVGPRWVHLDVRLEANYTEHDGQGGAQQFYTIESWRMRRAAGTLSKGPGEIAALACPACGSPAELTPQGACRYCGEIVATGNFHWLLQSITLLTRRPPEPIERLPGGGVEPGFHHPTVFQPDFQAARRVFQMRYPEFSWQAFGHHVQQVFVRLNRAWTEKDWSQARPYETDHLFDTHRYWIERYRAEGLTNRTDDAKILKLQPCKIEQDAFYELITVRLYASMLDYTVEDATGNVVSGSNREPRQFSEYWTFLRRTGFDPAKDGDTSHCPSCGAPVKVNMAGICEFCESRITTGEFDWVLSAIDQDETYAG